MRMLICTFALLFALDAAALDRRRPSSPAPRPTDLQVGCWMWAGNEALLDAGIAWIFAHINDRPNIIGPAIYHHATIAMVTKDLYVYLRRERWCGPVRAVEVKLTGDEVRAYRTSIEVMLAVSKQIEEGP